MTHPINFWCYYLNHYQIFFFEVSLGKSQAIIFTRKRLNIISLVKFDGQVLRVDNCLKKLGMGLVFKLRWFHIFSEL